MSPHLLPSLQKRPWACLTKDQRGSAKAPPPRGLTPQAGLPAPVHPSLSYDHPGLLPWASSHSPSPTPPSSGVSEPHQPQAPAAWLLAVPRRQGAAGCPQPTMHQACGFLPSSSLSTRALGRGTLVERGQQLIPSCRLVGCGCGAPKGATVVWRLPFSLAQPQGPGCLLLLFLPKVSRRQGCCGNGTVQPAPSPLLPLSPEQVGSPPRPLRPLEGEASHGLAWSRLRRLAPRSVLRPGEPAKG